jgi:hypothetical protein
MKQDGQGLQRLWDGPPPRGGIQHAQVGVSNDIREGLLEVGRACGWLMWVAAASCASLAAMLQPATAGVLLQPSESAPGASSQRPNVGSPTLPLGGTLAGCRAHIATVGGRGVAQHTAATLLAFRALTHGLRLGNTNIC